MMRQIAVNMKLIKVNQVGLSPNDMLFFFRGSRPGLQIYILSMGCLLEMLILFTHCQNDLQLVLRNSSLELMILVS